MIYSWRFVFLIKLTLYYCVRKC